MELKAAARLRHEALLYDSDDEFVAALVPFLAEGVDTGDAAVAVTTPRNIDLLRGALGGRAGLVGWIDAAEHYRRPATTIAAYDALVDAAVGRGSPGMRVVGEVQFGSTPGEHIAWTRYESVLNHLFETAPLWAICPYDRRVLAPGVLRDACRTHPHLWRRGRHRLSTEYTDPSSLLRAIPVPGEQPHGTAVAGLPPAFELRALRRRIAGEARQAGLSEAKAEAFAAAVHEVVSNALTHGGGDVDVRLRVAAARVVCEVEDQRGGWDDPFAGYVKPRAADDERGRGLWLARHLCDDLVVLPRGASTLVRLVAASG